MLSNCFDKMLGILAVCILVSRIRSNFPGGLVSGSARTLSVVAASRTPVLSVSVEPP
jgi:hypothetical protein